MSCKISLTLPWFRGGKVIPVSLLQSINSVTVVDIDTVWAATVHVFDKSDQRIQSVCFIEVQVIAEVVKTIQTS